MKNVDNVGKIALAGAALTAGSTGTAVADAEDFAGFYGGGGYASLNAPFAYDGYGTYSGAASVELFTGYNHVVGDTVYGGEFAFHTPGTTDGGDDFYGFESLVDLKFKIGRPVGNGLVYGIVGYSSGQGCFEDCDYPVKGVSFGVGLEQNVTDKIFWSGEILARDFYEEDKIGEYSQSVTTTIRVGFRF